MYRLLTAVGFVILALGLIHGLSTFKALPPRQPLLDAKQVLTPISCGSPWRPSSNLRVMPGTGGQMVTPCTAQVHARRSRADQLIGVGAVVVLGAALWDTRRRRAANRHSLDQKVQL